MAVLSLDITSRQPLADGRSFGEVGRYEQIDATAYFGVDPSQPQNQCITDIGLAPRDEQGLVRFSADVRILKPFDATRANHRLFWDVTNRGNRIALRMINRATQETLPS